MAGCYHHREGDIYCRIAIGVGHYVSRANEGLSLPVTKWVTLRVGKKFYSEGCVRHTIQTPLNVCVTATAYN